MGIAASNLAITCSIRSPGSPTNALLEPLPSVPTIWTSLPAAMRASLIWTRKPLPSADLYPEAIDAPATRIRSWAPSLPFKWVFVAVEAAAARSPRSWVLNQSVVGDPETMVVSVLGRSYEQIVH